MKKYILIIFILLSIVIMIFINRAVKRSQLFLDSSIVLKILIDNNYNVYDIKEYKDHNHPLLGNIGKNFEFYLATNNVECFIRVVEYDTSNDAKKASKLMNSIIKNWIGSRNTTFSYGNLLIIIWGDEYKIRKEIIQKLDQELIK